MTRAQAGARRRDRVAGRRQPARVSAIAREIDKVASAPKAVARVATPTPTLGAPFQIVPVRSVLRRFINAMIYGPYGHGKTTFVGSADDVPSMRDVLFINADSGTMSLTDKRTMDFIDINNYDQLARIFEYLVLHCYYRDQVPMNKEKLLEMEREYKATRVEVEDQTGEPDPDRTWFVEQRLRSGKPLDEPYVYRTVILDSISELHKYLVYKFTGVDIGTHPLDEEVEKMESWQPAQELFRLMIRSFRDLPMNSLFVCAEEIGSRSESDRKKGRKPGVAYPKLAGAMAGDLAGFLDIVGYLEREIVEGGTHRYLYLAAGYEGWISKHRFQNLPDLEYVDDPTLLKLIELSRKDAEAHGTDNQISAAAVSTLASSGANTAATNRRRSANAPSSRRSRA